MSREKARVTRHEMVNVDAVRGHHGPRENYRVSVYRYAKLTRFNGAMRAGLCYVLRGACRYDFGESVTIQAGEVAELPAGDYEFEVLGADDVELVMVWELPPEVRPS